MKRVRLLTSIIKREGAGYVSSCPELEIASQGSTREEARKNLIEAAELFYESASPEEIQEREPSEFLVVPIEVTIS